MLECRSIEKSFSGNKAVRDLSFSLQEREIFGIVGPDGAGKSTLLRMLACLMQPDRGNIVFSDKNIFEQPRRYKQKIAYMPQRFGLYEDLSVEENIRFYGQMFGMSRRAIDAQLPSLYSFSQLEQFKDRLAGKLSGGMKQKLGLACALVHRPELIILDEPTNGVDPVSRREFWKILYNLLADGVAIIVSTAYLDEAERCSRVALMYNGEFITIDTPQAIRNLTGKTLLQIHCSNPFQAEKYLRSESRFAGLIRNGDRLRLFSAAVDRDRQEINDLLKETECKLKNIEVISPTLEDTFIEVISSRSEEASHA